MSSRHLSATRTLGLAAAIGAVAGLALDLARPTRDGADLGPSTSDRVSTRRPGSLPDQAAGPAGEPSARRPPRSLLPGYPGARLAPLSDHLELGGMPIDAWWFEVADSPEQVLGYFQEALAKLGIPSVAHRYGPAAGFVGYLQMPSDELHLVSVLREQGSTRVFVSASQPRRHGAASSQPSGLLGLPLEGHFTAPAGEAGAPRAAWGTVSEASVGDAIEALARALPHAQLERQPQDRAGVTRVVVRQGAQRSGLLLCQRPAGSGVTLFAADLPPSGDPP